MKNVRLYLVGGNEEVLTIHENFWPKILSPTIDNNSKRQFIQQYIWKALKENSLPLFGADEGPCRRKTQDTILTLKGRPEKFAREKRVFIQRFRARRFLHKHRGGIGLSQRGNRIRTTQQNVESSSESLLTIATDCTI